MFPSAASLRAITTSITRDATVQLGSRVTVRRRTPVVHTDNSTTYTWASVASDVPLRITDITETDRRTLWGYERAYDAQGSSSEDADIRPFDVVVVTASPRADLVGRAYQVERRVDVELAGSIRLALIDAPPATLIDGEVP